MHAFHIIQPFQVISKLVKDVNLEPNKEPPPVTPTSTTTELRSSSDRPNSEDNCSNSNQDITATEIQSASQKSEIEIPVALEQEESRDIRGADQVLSSQMSLTDEFLSAEEKSGSEEETFYNEKKVESEAEKSSE